MSTKSKSWPCRDSWPPTQVRLVPSTSRKHRGSSRSTHALEDIDDNPLTYFLTPTPTNDGEAADDDMDFDAGIEDAHSGSRELVRSVSPSTLDGFGKPDARAASPDLDSDGLTTDDDDDGDDGEEEYIRFTPGGSSRLSSLRNMAIDGLKVRTRSPDLGGSAASFPSPSWARGRSSARPRPSRLWREPSPDVWSIEEETEEEMMGEKGASATEKEAAAVQEMAAKPKKRVRFLLPSMDP
ncbi:hypothetical protein RJ55_04553 [Drechmeria coniospora]|nr:hypothetical protein RJ55_04553 [Drechmeria coniospora]